jgi:putative DNA methylase
MPTRKLIEVALPLEAINTASAREKSIRHGHPSTLHLWWARRPLAACRAVLFASLVDDPSSHPDRFPTEEAQQRERERLFGIIERLVKWENSNNEHVLREARDEILKHTNGNPPPVYDPFAGGGSIPLEAQRLGLEAHASDLNPVAVLINKALIEIPPRFANMPPVNPESRKQQIENSREELGNSAVPSPISYLLSPTSYKGAAGLAADVRYYGKWMRDEAEKRIGHLYPKVRLPKEYGGGEATVIAWLWARTVKCPNPACGAQMPLVRSFSLSTKKGKESWVEPVIEHGTPPRVRFTVKRGVGKPQEGTVGRRGARCLCCGTPVMLDHVRIEGRAGRMGAQMMAIVAEGKHGRIYLPPSEEQEQIAASAQPAWAPDTDLPEQALGFRVQNYGLTKHRELFTQRQLTALTTFSDLVGEARALVRADAANTGVVLDPAAYADAVATYLAFSISKIADRNSTIATWAPNREHARNTFTRQAISMTWDFAESNVFSESSGNFLGGITSIQFILEELTIANPGIVSQLSASNIKIENAVFSTDPPYYDNVPYADLSDFLYIWLRSSLLKVYPELLATMLVPKAEELVAEPFRHGGKEASEHFFEQGMSVVFNNIRKYCNSSFSATIYYAFKQTEDEVEDDDDTESSELRASTGWQTFLEGLVSAGWEVRGTWPIRTELNRRMRNFQSNALASSIVLVCRPRPEDARAATRREFLNALKAELPGALRRLQQGNIAPVDLAQAAIGPGMAVFSRYSKVVESDGSPMRVRTALQIINQELDAVLAEQEGEFDGDTRWAIAWFDQYGVNEGPYGVAETLSKAKNTSVEGMVEAGIVVARSGKVRLLSRDELPADWDPGRDRRVTVWEVAQHLVHALDKRGEGGAAALLAQLGGEGEIARDLAYRLYTTCERKGWAQEALAYNSLVVAWPEIRRLAAEAQRGGVVQGRMEI